MGADNAVAPVIIKRKKVVAGDGHHGGAWKVAYADFVTAMMAFFMLMWLLNATTEQQRKGIADYFSPTIPVSRISGGGDGAFGGDNIFSEMVLPQNGIGASSRTTTEGRQARGAIGLRSEGESTGKSDSELTELEQALLGRGGESFIMEEAFKHVLTKVTDEGLVVELFETETNRLFDPSGNPTQTMMDLLIMIAEVGGLVTNDIAIEGHVPSDPIVIARSESWENSVARAHITRKALSDLRLPEERIVRVTGHADREYATENPLNIRNSRVEIIFLRE